MHGTQLPDDSLLFSTTSAEQWSELESILYFLFYAGALLLVALLFTWHTFKISSDLCSKDRSSVSHLRHAPKLTFKYKMINYLTYLCIFLYLWYLLTCTIQMTDSDYQQCVLTTYLWTYPWLLSKATMYCIFLLRLDLVYSNSVYGYNRCFLYALAILVILASLTLSSVLISAMHESEFFTDNDALPNPCFVWFPYWGYSTFLAYDFLANTVCLILFVVPLYRVVKAVRDSSHGGNRTTERMIYVGVKLLIVTAVCVLTTVMTLTFLSTGFLGYMCGVDVVVNCVCVVLMTPYYKDTTYYQRICCLCLCCCPKKYRQSSTVRISQIGSSSNITMQVSSPRSSATSPRSTRASTQTKKVAQGQYILLE